LKVVPLCVSVLLTLAAAAESRAGAYFAAGFSGPFARTVALGPDDAVVACRAMGELGEGRRLGLARSVHEDGVRLWMRGDSAFHIPLDRYALVADGEAYPLASTGAPDELGVMRLPLETAEAVERARALSLQAEDRRVALPDGFADAVRFVRRCRA
jgi:hypothetical protein